jgi:NhaA family Na+:H+ antiporter
LNGIRDDHALLPQLDTLQTANREAVSPVERLQHQLHGWVAFGVMPLFAFANAGVPLRQITFDGDALWVFLGVTIGMAIGKPVGILAVSWLVARMGVAALPSGVDGLTSVSWGWLAALVHNGPLYRAACIFGWSVAGNSETCSFLWFGSGGRPFVVRRLSDP